MNLLDLLSRGHIPRELPPAFSSEKFAEFYVNSKIKPATINSKNSRGTKFSYPKVGLIRKIITLTNPHNQTPLFECINVNWTEIQSHYSQSKISANQPTSTTKISTNGRAIYWSSFKEFRRQCFTESYFHKYELKTDISKYYPSIYTHSIAWTIHGKVKAKKQRRDKNLLGNKLDYLVQQTQDGQTSGLPIGPDSSVIIAEIIGTEIDKHIQSVFPEITGYRYVDDMYLYFDSQANAELCLKEIEHVFRDFLYYK